MTAPTATLDSLRSKHEELILRAEVQTLERLVKGEELASRLVESQWGDVVDRREHLFDTPGWNRGEFDFRLATAGDRSRGKSYPVFETETDLQNIVGIGRHLADCTAIGIAAMEALLSFTLGTGFQYEAEPREEKADAKNPLVAEVNRAIEEILEGNQWTGDKEDECFRRAHRDGECLRWAKDEGGFPLIEIPEPSYLTEPAQVRDLEDYLGSGGYDWSFGVATLPGRHDRPFGYFLKWEGRDWDVAPAAEVSHVKLNVDRQVKRGVSDFYPTREVIEQTIKLSRNVMQGAAIQAAIAYIREHAAGTTGDQITSFRNSKATHTAQQSAQKGGVQTVYGEKIAPGTIKDVGAGMKYHAGPLGQPNHPQFVPVIQAGFRMAGIRWGFPEFMLSADASNNNYASILVAGSPFIRATERRQAIHKRANEDLMWKALAVFVRRGRFQSHGIGTLTELKREVQLKVDAPNAAIANRLEEEGIRDQQQAAGVLSKKTRSAQSNLDYDVEQANIAEEPKPAPAVPGANPLGVLEDCGTGAGGFKSGNECAKEDGSSSLEGKGGAGKNKDLTKESNEFLDNWSRIAESGDKQAFAKVKERGATWLSGGSDPALDELYKNTQDKLAKAGVSKVEAYRGLPLPANHPIAKALSEGTLKPGQTIKLSQSEIGSWSEKVDSAERFASYGGDVPVVLKRSIEAKDIVASHRTQFGFLRGESELIAKNDAPVEVTIHAAIVGNKTLRESIFRTAGPDTVAAALESVRTTEEAKALLETLYP